MIARIWRGITPAPKAEGYLEYLNKKVLPLYLKADGNQGVYVLREIQGELAYFVLLSFWVSQQALVAFTCPDLETARQDPEEKKFLVAFESIVNHYDVMTVLDLTHSSVET